MIKVLLLASIINIGDMSNAEQTLRIIKDKAQPEKVIFATVDASLAPEALVKAFAAKAQNTVDCFLLIAISDNGIKALKTLMSHNMIRDNMYVYWSGHQLFDDLKHPAALGIEHILLPSFTINDEALSKLRLEVKHVDTVFGVPTKNTSLSELERTYHQWNVGQFGPKPDLNKKYIIVMLPGDAPDIDGKIKLFTKNSAKSLFDHVSALYTNIGSNVEILIHNGPRTGRHNPEDVSSIACNHEYEKGMKPPVDDISQYFVSLLQNSGISHQFLNFGFEVKNGKKRASSVSDALIYIATYTDSYYILPAESVSQISQLTLYIDPSRLIAFEPDSMNNEHDRLLDEAFAAGYLSKFGRAGNVISPERGVLRTSDDVVQVLANVLEAARAKCTNLGRKYHHGPK